MKTISRRLHDFYTGLATLAGSPLRKCTETDANAELKHTIAQQAGQVPLNNQLEADFYDQPDKARVHHWPQGGLYHLRNVCVTGDQGGIFLEDGRCLHVCNSFTRLPDRKIRRPISWIAERIKEPLFHLTGFSHENHGHFILNHLTRLVSALDFLKANPKVKILCARGHSKWQLRYLTRLGFGPDRVIECSHGTIQCDELYYVPMLNGWNNLAEPRIYQLLQQCFVEEIRDEIGQLRQSSSQGKPIFISRAKAPDKKISNESELIDIVKEVFGGVETIELTGIPMNDQIRIFNRTSLIIGPMGQGMTNILYSRGKVMLVLDRGMALRPEGAASMFCFLGAICGNRGLRFASGTDYEDGKKFYFFPPDEFRRKSIQLRELLGVSRSKG